MTGCREQDEAQAIGKVKGERETEPMSSLIAGPHNFFAFFSLVFSNLATKTPLR